VKVLLSWIREFVDIGESGDAIGRRMSLRGLALEGLEDGLALTTPPWGRPGSTDTLFDFDVTANRPDCLSVAGIAREIAVAYRLPFKEPAERWQALGTSGALPLPITITDPDLCHRYVGAMAEVTIGPSPAWMADRLEACGVRPISNIVDITNYVLLELGQPMHAFDRARLAGPSIVVRRARKGESLRTLDGRARVMAPDMLVIADAERASAIGGVMGGADSEVASGTARIVFEAAWFLPMSVRATSKALGLRTEASIRFERGADLTAPPIATARAAELLDLIGAGG
jgi:phenylalanyl-tRNA synthetase beta chain